MGFKNRVRLIEMICNSLSHQMIVYFLGEAGIGKTVLLKEIGIRLRSQLPNVIILYVDMKIIGERGYDYKESLLTTLIREGEKWLNLNLGQAENTARQISEQLCEVASQHPVVVIFDSTESIQVKTEFWRWMETNLFRPLCSGRIIQLFAGRQMATIPAPTKQKIFLEVIPPLNDPQDSARELILEILLKKQPSLNHNYPNQVIDLVLDLSCYHPLLIIELSTAIANCDYSSIDFKTIRHELCSKVVEPVIHKIFLFGLSNHWNVALWWMSILDGFQISFLGDFLHRMDTDHFPYLDNNIHSPGRIYPDFYYEFKELRYQRSIIVVTNSDQELYCISGLWKDIMRKCLKEMKPAIFQQACLEAKQVVLDQMDYLRTYESFELSTLQSDAEKYDQMSQEVVI